MKAPTRCVIFPDDEVNEMSNIVKGKFSATNGSKVRMMYDASGNLIGTITKQSDGSYRIFRLKDGKTRVKEMLVDAYKSIARAN
jgi:hypothetical protein